MNKEDKVIDAIFEKAVKRADLVSDFFDIISIREEVKFFIEEALAGQKEDIIKKIEGMKKSPKNETRELVADIHNQALKDIINLIQ